MIGSERGLEVRVGLVALTLSTVGLLLQAYTFGVLALVAGAVGFGLLLGRRTTPDRVSARTDDLTAAEGLSELIDGARTLRPSVPQESATHGGQRCGSRAAG